MVFEDVLNVKKKLCFRSLSLLAILSKKRSHGESSQRGGLHDAFENDLRKSEGFDDCNMENVLDFYKGDYDKLMNVFIDQILQICPSNTASKLRT